jgi:hypothetical protein
MNSKFPKSGGIAILVMTAAIMVIGFGVAIGFTTQQAEAARSGPQWEYCFNRIIPGETETTLRCLPNNGECHQAQATDDFPTSGCFKRSIPLT